MANKLTIQNTELRELDFDTIDSNVMSKSRKRPVLLSPNGISTVPVVGQTDKKDE